MITPTLIETDNRKSVRFNSFYQFLAWQRQLTDQQTTFRYGGAGRQASIFNGNTTRQQAIDLAANGWQAGFNSLAVTLPAVKPRYEDQQGAYMYDVTGDFYDIGAVIAGEPEHWLRPEQEPTRKVVKVIVNIGQLGDVSPDTINRRGALTCGLVTALEEQGFIVELEAISHAVQTHGNGYFTCSFPVGTTPLDMLELAYISGHPSMLRHLVFSAREQYYRSNGGNYSTHDLPAAERGGVIYIGCGGGNLAPYSRSDSAAREWIEQQITAQCAN